MNWNSDAEPRGAAALDERLRRTLADIAQLARGQPPPATFWSAFLAKICEALGAAGGIVWARSEAGWEAIAQAGKIPGEVGLAGASPTGPIIPDLTDPDLRERPADWETADEANGPSRHAQLLQQVLDDGDACVVPPRIGDGRTDEHGNPTEFLLLFCPIGPAGESPDRTLVELFQRPGSPSANRRTNLALLVSACQIAAGYLQAQHYAALVAREKLWDEWDTFLQTIHGSLEPRRVAFDVACEARRLIGCDRASVALTRRGRQRLLAVSSQESFDNRSNPVQRLERLVQAVAQAGDPLWYTGETDHLSPQLVAALESYLEVTDVHSLAVVPFVRSGSGSEHRRASAAGALVFETFQQRGFDPTARERVEILLRPAGQALTNALTYDELFLMPLWRTLGKSRVLVQAKNLPKTTLVAIAVVVTAVILCVVPARFELEGRGTLLPVDRREVFAGVDGEVVRVLAGHGQQVAAGEILCELQNPDLDVQLAAVEGQRNATADKLRSIGHTLLGSEKLDEYERTKLHGERLQVDEELRSLQRQQALLQQKQEKLIVRSPIAGQVVTWDAIDTLIHRPVKRGDALLSIVRPEGEWELEVRMPDNRMGYIAKAQADLGPDRPVSFVLATAPQRKLTGQVREVHGRAEVHGEDGNTVLVRVAFDKSQLASLRPGAEVTARIDCGRRPLGYVWLHDVFDWLHAKVLFRLF